MHSRSELSGNPRGGARGMPSCTHERTDRFEPDGLPRGRRDQRTANRMRCSRTFSRIPSYATLSLVKARNVR